MSRALHLSRPLRTLPVQLAQPVSGAAAAGRSAGRMASSARCRPCGLSRSTTLAHRQPFPRCGTRPAIPSLSFRCFATSSSGGGSSRWQSLPANFVPFARSLPDAQAAYLAWAKGQWLAPEYLKSLQAVHSVDQSYLPFYAFDAVVESRFGGRVGFNYTELVYNANTRSYQTVQRTRWREVAMGP